MIYLLNIPGIIAALLLVPHWPTTHNLTSDWANFTGSLLIFLWGFTVCGSDRFLELIGRRRREFLYVAAVLLALFYGIRLIPGMGSLPGVAQLVIFTLVDSYFGLAVILALVGWSRARLNRDSAALRYANTAVYPFYIVHQTITILLGYAWLGWDVPFAVKFPALFAGTFLGSWICYEAVRRTRVTRVLFGMKARLKCGLTFLHLTRISQLRRAGCIRMVRSPSPQPSPLGIGSRRARRCESTERSDLSSTWQMVLPLPKGEGWGEGKLPPLMPGVP